MVCAFLLDCIEKMITRLCLNYCQNFGLDVLLLVKSVLSVYGVSGFVCLILIRKSFKTYLRPSQYFTLIFFSAMLSLVYPNRSKVQAL